MTGALVKKDYLLLIRNNFLAVVGSLVFILIIIGINLGIASYFMMMLAGVWQLLLSSNGTEVKSKSTILLISAPYTRSKVVSAKYMSALLMYVLLTVIYGVVSFAASFFTDTFPTLTVPFVFLGFVVAAVFISITIPLYLKFSEFTVRIISLVIILGGFFLLAFLWETFGASIRPLLASPAVVFALGLAVSVFALLASRTIAVRMAKRIEY